MLNKFILFIGFIWTLSFTACSNTNIQEIEKMNVNLTNIHWKAVLFYDKRVKDTQKEAYIKFDEDGNLNGVLGCNNFFGTYFQKDDKINFGTLGSTKMMCQNMQIEDLFSKVLKNTVIYRIDGENLYFYNKESEKIANFKAVYF